NEAEGFSRRVYMCRVCNGAGNHRFADDAAECAKKNVAVQQCLQGWPADSSRLHLRRKKYFSTVELERSAQRDTELIVDCGRPGCAGGCLDALAFVEYLHGHVRA